MKRLLHVCALTVVFTAPGMAQEFKAKAASVPAGVIYDKGVEFGKGGDATLHMDIARPAKADKPLPCIVVIHGGAWKEGGIRFHLWQVFDFAQHGYVSATVQYRLVPAGRWPAQIEDVKCAVRYLRANAEKYGIDKDRFGAVGFSAGAHLSMLLGTMDAKDGLEGSGGNAEQSSKVQAVVSYFGPTDLAHKDFWKSHNEVIYSFLGGTPDEKPEAFQAASPVHYVDQGDSPILMYHGTNDVLVPYNQAYLMADALTKAGVAGRVELLLGANHGWGGAESMRTTAATMAFFDGQLKK